MLSTVVVSLLLSTPTAEVDPSHDRAVLLGGRVDAGVLGGVGGLGGGFDFGLVAGLRLQHFEASLELGGVALLASLSDGEAAWSQLGIAVGRRFDLSSSVQLTLRGRGGLSVALDDGRNNSYMGLGLGFLIRTWTPVTLEFTALDARGFFSSDGGGGFSTPNAFVGLQTGLRLTYEAGF